MTAARVLPSFQAGIALLHIAPCFPHLLWSAERGGYYLQACGTTVSTSFSAGIQGVGPCSAHLVQRQHGMQLSAGLRHIPALCFPPPGLSFEQHSCTIGVKSVSEISMISVVRATDL